VREILTYANGEVMDSDFAEQLLMMEEGVDVDRNFAETIANSTMDVVLALTFNSTERVQYGALPESIVTLPEAVSNTLSLNDMAG